MKLLNNFRRWLIKKLGGYCDLIETHVIKYDTCNLKPVVITREQMLDKFELEEHVSDEYRKHKLEYMKKQVAIDIGEYLMDQGLVLCDYYDCTTIPCRVLRYRVAVIPVDYFG